LNHDVIEYFRKCGWNLPEDALVIRVSFGSGTEVSIGNSVGCANVGNERLEDSMRSSH